jgi:hypothetical protein
MGIAYALPVLGAVVNVVPAAVMIVRGSVHCWF